MLNNRKYILLMLLKYESICARNLHNILDIAKCKVLSDLDLKNTIECFASPLNRNLQISNYCSIFDDIDKYFGSSGDIFYTQYEEFIGKTLYMHPPDVKSILQKTQEFILDLLKYMSEQKYKINIVLIWATLEPIDMLSTHPALTHISQYTKLPMYYYNCHGGRCDIDYKIQNLPGYTKENRFAFCKFTLL
jgi:hypothetical protein